MNLKNAIWSVAALLMIGLFSGCGDTSGTDKLSSQQPCEDTGGLINPCDDPSAIMDATGKPVIYLYPEEAMEIAVSLDYKGRVTTEYPEREKGVWRVWAEPSGLLTLGNRAYDYLFWEGYSPLTATFDFPEGFVVHRDDYVPFLEETLTILGLNAREQNDFITYWLPQMQPNEWSKIRFLYDEYEAMADLTVTPAPDTFIRVFMIVAEASPNETLPEQSLEEVAREGFTVVEWGGSYLTRE